MVPRRMVALTAGIALAATVGTPVAAAPDVHRGPDRSRVVEHRPHNLPGPLSARQDARREAAQRLLLSGQAAPDRDGVVQLAEDKYFQAALTGVGRVFTVLAEFGTDGSGKLGTVPGPLHNEIPEPDRSLDNSSVWVADFDRGYYEDLFFGAGESFADFYAQQSSGSYTVAGSVSDWVLLPNNESSYGDNSLTGEQGYWAFVEDTVTAWYDAQVAAGRTLSEIRAELATFDVWDRYDFDEDGDFAEPDGYLDHFQAVHAGVGEEAEGGAQGSDAIWSHRWYVNGDDFGVTGPTVDGTAVLFGGAPIGDTGFWVGDYTTEPEDGGLGAFAHEFAHDLGLPDLYDTTGAQNGTGFWTLMSHGTYLNHGGEDVGSTPGHMGPWEKLQLGWLDYAVVGEGTSGSFTLSPAARQVTGQEQALVVDVPDEVITTAYTTPYSGTNAWWTGSSSNLTSTLTRTFDLTGLRSATVQTKAWYDIEAGFDYLFAEYSTDGGDTWTRAGTSVDGDSGDRWVTLRHSLPGGGPVTFRYRFASDGSVNLGNAFLDDFLVKSGRTVVFRDDVEAGANGWGAAGGFVRSDGVEDVTGDRYYLLENRTYVGYDATLEIGPFQFSRDYSAYFWVDRFPYFDGMVVWAVDEAWSDNNTSEHPGHGLALVVDARPGVVAWPDGVKPIPMLQVLDAAFGVQATSTVTFRREVLSGHGPGATIVQLEATVPASAGVPTFTDADPDAYWDPALPRSSTYVAGHGVTATVETQVTAGAMTVTVNNPAG